MVVALRINLVHGVRARRITTFRPSNETRCRHAAPAISAPECSVFVYFGATHPLRRQIVPGRSLFHHRIVAHRHVRFVPGAVRYASGSFWPGSRLARGSSRPSRLARGSGSRLTRGSGLSHHPVAVTGRVSRVARVSGSRLARLGSRLARVSVSRVASRAGLRVASRAWLMPPYRVSGMAGRTAPQRMGQGRTRRPEKPPFTTQNF